MEQNTECSIRTEHIKLNLVRSWTTK